MTEARILESEIGSVIPVADIAELIGYSRSAMSHAIKAYDEKMSPCKILVTLPSSGGPQPFLCLNREGVDYLFLIIHPTKKSGMSLDRLLELRKNILAKMDRATKEITRAAPPVPALDEELTEAIHIAEVCKKSPDLFLSAVLEKHGRKWLAAKLETAPGIIHGETGWYNVSQLVAMCDDPQLTPERLNYYLWNNPKDPQRRPYQYRDMNKLWRLTLLGQEHGEEYLYTCPSKHQEIRIRWRESILYASGLKRQIEKDQLALPGKTRS